MKCKDCGQELPVERLLFDVIASSSHLEWPWDMCDSFPRLYHKEKIRAGNKKMEELRQAVINLSKAVRYLLAQQGAKPDKEATNA